jgi:Tfp pilus assembly protein PilF/4-amino-4-deoxy-L-arabinose transferase-like glycosyltransferase
MKRFLRRNKWPLVIFLAAFFIRLIYIIQSRSNPTFYYPMVDELWNLNWAREIIGGNFRGDEAYFRGPLYPYLLAFFLKITGSSLFMVRLFQALIGSGSALLVYLLGQKLISKKVGLIAGLAYAAYGTIIFYESMLLIPVLFIFLNLLAVYLMIQLKGQFHPSKWLIAGIVLGLAAIARPNILLLLPFFLIWIYLTLSELKEIKKKFTIALIYLAGVLIPVLSVTLRNYIASGETILISSQGGVNFYIGNNPETEGLTMLMPELDLNEALPWTEFTQATREAAEKEAGRKLSASEESSFWTNKALKFIWNNPGEFIAVTLKKTVYFLVGFENSDQTDIYDSRRYSSLYSILLWKKIICFPFGLILPFCLIGMIHLWRRKSSLSLFYIFIIGYIPTVVLFLVTARHRLPIIPFMLLFAAAGAIALWNFYTNKDWRRFGKYAFLFLVVLILSNRTYFDIGFENVFQTHLNLALTYERQGNPTKAEQEYRKALEAYPYSAMALNNLGLLLHNQDRNDEAMTTLRKAINADPKYARAYNNIGLVFESLGKYDEAEKLYWETLKIEPELYQAYINLGDIYVEKKDYSGSEKAYNKALKIAPDDRVIYFKLGILYAKTIKFAKAEEMFLAGEKLGPMKAIDYFNWGNIYYSTKQPDRAIEMYRKAIRTDPALAEGYYGLGATFHRFNHPTDSVKIYLRKALQYKPGLAAARDLLESLDKKQP